jgi:hypothetical protein
MKAGPGWIVLHQADEGITRVRREGNEFCIQIVTIGENKACTLRIVSEADAMQFVSDLTQAWCLDRGAP